MQWQEKLNQLSKLQKTHEIQYIIIKSLYESFCQTPQIATKSIFKSLYANISQVMRKLHLYKKLSYLIWQNQDLPIQLRECCSILTMIGQWIVYFQMKMSGLKSIGSQFAMIKQFMKTYCKSYEDKIILIDQIYQDLKQMFQEKFWQNFPSQLLQNDEQSEILSATSEDAEQIIEFLQLLIQKQIMNIGNKKSSEFIYEASQFYDNKYYQFILRCLHYLLSINLKNSLQSSATNLSLLFIQSSFTLNNPILIIDLLKKLMIRTKKVVRFAAMRQYIEMYQFLKRNQAVQILQSMEDIIYFRQLIIGQSKYQEQQIVKQTLQYPLQLFTSLYIKAGSKERIFFSNQQSELQVLNLQLLINQKVDITLRVYHLNRNKEDLYYLQEKTVGSKHLQILLKLKGLYSIEFDNVYSWVVGKQIKYKLGIYKQFHRERINQFSQEVTN